MSDIFCHEDNCLASGVTNNLDQAALNIKYAVEQMDELLNNYHGQNVEAYNKLRDRIANARMAIVTANAHFDDIYNSDK